jgi:hypothetical protein
MATEHLEANFTVMVYKMEYYPTQFYFITKCVQFLAGGMESNAVKYIEGLIHLCHPCSMIAIDFSSQITLVIELEVL